jgi:hypothetical protein
MALGQAVHAAAHDIATAVIQGRDPPDLSALEERARATLNELWRASFKRTGSDYHPRPGAPLREAWYGEQPARTRIDAMAGRLSRCLSSLTMCPTWDALRAADPRSVVLAPQFGTAAIEGASVLGTPDLAFRPARATYDDPAPEWVIVEWKTGAPGAVREQLAVYALWLAAHEADAYPHPRPTEAWWDCRIHLLSIGASAPMVLHPHDLAAAARRIASSAATMQALRPDQGQLTADAVAFAQTANRSHCAHCNFLALCRPELLTVDIPASRAVREAAHRATQEYPILG